MEPAMEIEDLLMAVAMRAFEEAGSSASESQLRQEVDVGAVQAALTAPFYTVDSVLLYPGPVEQAAILAARIAQTVQLPGQLERAVALLFADIRLQYAGLELRASATETHAMFSELATGSVADDALIGWFTRRARPLRTRT